MCRNLLDHQIINSIKPVAGAHSGVALGKSISEAAPRGDHDENIVANSWAVMLGRDERALCGGIL
jgi:hypothetical protein